MGTLLAAFFKNNLYNCNNMGIKYDCGSSVKVI